MIWRGLLVFVAVALSEIFWAWTVSHAAHGDRWRAAIYATVLFFVQSVVVIAYTGDHRMLGPALVGAFVGMAIGVRRRPGV